MIITIDEIVNSVATDFVNKYPHFKDFSSSEYYSPFWKLCLRAVHDRDLLGHIIFCNDIFSIPPVKSFLCYYSHDLVEITGKSNAELDNNVKKSIGAFWGYIFKYVFEYAGQKSVSVSLNKMFMLKTATYYCDPQKTLILAY